jgi:hypothetical protein
VRGGGEQDALDAGPEPDARKVWAAELGDQAVVAPPRPHRVLGA